MRVQGTTDNDDLSGSSHHDNFRMDQGGSDTVHGLGGSDIFFFGRSLDESDRIDGGAGLDGVVINRGADVHITANMFTSVEGLFFEPDRDYSVTFDANPGAHGLMEIGAFRLGAGDSAVVDASAESSLHFEFIGGNGHDEFIGGQRGDLFIGSKGSDTYTPNGGTDFFAYTFASDSTGLRFDTINGFDVRHDVFAPSFPVADVDAAVTGGTLDGNTPNTFNASLAAAIGEDQLAAQDAVVFQPDAGSWAGRSFVIIDQNNVAGYQAHQDLVIELIGRHVETLSTHNFLTIF